MSCIVDIKCDDCKNIFEYDKLSISNDVPSDIECPKCKSKNTHRVFGFQAFDVGTGMMGNASNGYSKGVVYHDSKFTPKGKRNRIK